MMTPDEHKLLNQRSQLRPLAVNIAIAVIGVICINPKSILLIGIMMAMFSASGDAYKWFCWLEKNNINPFFVNVPEEDRP